VVARMQPIIDADPHLLPELMARSQCGEVRSPGIGPGGTSTATFPGSTTSVAPCPASGATSASQRSRRLAA
jgi:hypothetical protein